MPVTSDIGSVTASGIFAGSGTPNINIASNYLHVDGCSTYSSSGSSGIVLMNSGMNKGYV